MKTIDKCKSCKYFNAHFIIQDKIALFESECGHCTRNNVRKLVPNCKDYEYSRSVDFANRRVFFVSKMLEEIRQYMTDFNKKIEIIYQDLFKG